MAQKISESELVLMKIIWQNGGSALYSHIMEELEKRQEPVEEQHCIDAAFPAGRERVFEDQEDRQAE